MSHADFYDIFELGGGAVTDSNNEGSPQVNRRLYLVALMMECVCWRVAQILFVFVAFFFSTQSFAAPSASYASLRDYTNILDAVIMPIVL